MNSSEKIMLDPERFAAAVTSKFPVQASADDPERYAKECLKIYLTAMILAKDFNFYEEHDYRKSEQSLFDSFIQALSASQANLSQGI